MPRGFTADDRCRIERMLLEAGKDAFSRKGIRKTSIDELVNSVGISKGAFYQFFESKEALYFRLMRETEKVMHDAVLNTVRSDTQDSRTQLKTILSEAAEQVDSDPFLRMLLQGDEYDYLRTKFSDDQLAEAMAADLGLTKSLMEVWRRRGCLLVEDERVVAGVFRAVFMLMLHKEDIGGDDFSDVLSLIIDGSVDRLLSG